MVRGIGRLRAPRRPPRTATALAAAAFAVVTVGLVLDQAGVGLGTELPPFFASFDPGVASAAPLALVVLVAATVLGARAVEWSASPAAFAAYATALAAAARLALAAAGGGTGSFSSVFGTDPEAANEYLPALPALDRGIGPFLDRFAEVVPSLPIHPSAHPPGLLIALDLLGIDGAGSMAALVIVLGLAVVPLTYLLSRRVGLDPGRARIATLLVAFSPAAMIYGVTSTDALFASLGMVAAVLLLGSGLASRIAGALALAFAALFSWALLAIGAFAFVVVSLRERLRDGIAMAALAAAALLGTMLALWGIWGFDPIGSLAAASDVYELGISNARPWIFWVFGSPVAWALASGIPIAWYAARALGQGAAVAVGLAVIVTVAAALGFSKAETERIWLFMAPLAAVAAAYVIPRDRAAPVLGLLVAQAIAIELLLGTTW